jgi:rhodanese-related sulfurtransferase
MLDKNKLSGLIKKQPAQPAQIKKDSSESIPAQPTQPVPIIKEQPVSNSPRVGLPTDELAQRIQSLQDMLEGQNSDIRNNLIVIHRELSKDPAIVTILSTEQRATIFQGYKKQAGIEVVAKDSKKRATKKQVDLSDFM